MNRSGIAPLAERARLSPWAPVASLFLLGVGHVSLSYTAAGLRCHDKLLAGEIASIDAFRLAMLAVTLTAAAALVGIGLIAVRGRAHDGGDAQLARVMTAVLGGILAAYLVWSVVVTAIGTAVC